MLKTGRKKNVEEITQLVRTVREMFPQVDRYFSPRDLLGNLGIDLGELAACPTCLSCYSCQSCNSCQTCNLCQKCESCNTCQKQVGMAGCPIESPVVKPGGEVVLPAEQIRAELLQIMNALAARVRAV